MTQTAAMFLVFTGLVLTLFGVGGVENSLTNTELLTAVAVSVVGMATMYCGVLGLRSAEYYDER
jgi:hypothetical protein